MIKDKIFTSTLYQTAKVITIETSYDNKFNRPENIEKTSEYPCRIARNNSKAYPIITPSNTSISPMVKGYFEIDANITTGSVILVEGIKYIAGLPYKPMNHHIEVDLTVRMET